MNRIVARLLLGLACCAICGCAPQAEQSKSTVTPKSEAPAKPEAQKLNVAAAANLKFAFDAIETAFEQAHPEIDLVVTYGSSGSFFAQISQDAPFDIFLSADTSYPQKVVDQGLATQDSLFVYAVGRIVLWAPNNSPLDVQKLGLQAVVDPAVKKIAIGNPELAPYGKAAVAAMQHAGVYEAAKDRLVMGDNISQTAQFVESGAADLGFLALSLAVAPALKEKGRYFEIPAETYEPIEQAGVILSRSKSAAAANELRAFLLGTEGRKILTDFGYRAPGE